MHLGLYPRLLCIGCGGVGCRIGRGAVVFVPSGRGRDIPLRQARLTLTVLQQEKAYLRKTDDVWRKAARVFISRG